MLVHDFLQHSAATRPDKVALVCGGKRYTYAQIEAMANRLANALRKAGAKRGDRVGIYLHNSVETVVGMFGILKANAVFVVVNRIMKADKLVFILNNCQAVALLTDGRALGQGIGDQVLNEAPTVKTVIACGPRPPSHANGHGRCIDFSAIQENESADVPPRENIDLDLACLIYTSGTTGESKGVMSDHSNVVFVTQSIVEYLNNSERDIVMNVLPLAFSYGLYQLTAMFAVGGTLVLEQSFAFP